MQFIYYPGCSLEGSAQEYDASTRQVMEAFGADLVELEDWSCCGATAAHSTNHLMSLVLPARNLALAEKSNPGLEMLVPCSACYLNLKTVERKIGKEPELLQQINTVLAEEGLRITGAVKVRHLLDVLANDVGREQLAGMVNHPLHDLTIAPYYGCQCLRPYAEFDNPEDPHSMDGLIQAAGARVLDWSMGPKCCGASHMNTQMEVGLELSSAILDAAHNADAVATICPMCQMNLEAYQHSASELKGRSLRTTILYLPQLLGLSLGIAWDRLKINFNLSVTKSFKIKLKTMFIQQVVKA